MWHDITRNFKSSLRHLLSPPTTFLIFVAGYAALIVIVWLFLTTREATWWQIILTLLLALVAPYLFAALQAMGVRVGHGEAIKNDATHDVPKDLRQKRFDALSGGVARRAWRVMAACVPVILIGLLAVYLLNALDAKLTGDAVDVIRMEAQSNTLSNGEVGWRDALVTTLRVLLLGAIVPLIAVHLWAAVTNAGLAKSLRNALKIIASAFMPAALVTYTLGASLFILVPYLLITTRTPVSSAWLELTLLGVRLMFAFLFLVFGWTLTQGALSRLMINRLDFFIPHETVAKVIPEERQDASRGEDDATPHTEEKFEALPTQSPLMREA